MLFAFSFPFIDLRKFLNCNTYKLDDDTIDNIDGKVFLRSYGLMTYRNGNNKDLPFTEKYFANAKNAIHFVDMRKEIYKSSKIVYKRFFSNDVNCRVDVGIKINDYYHEEYKYLKRHIIYLLKNQVHIPSSHDNRYKLIQFKDSGEYFSP